MLDAEEYLHLAIHASQHGEHHAALSYLKQSLALSPEAASAHYLQAAEHAELGLYTRAIAGMQHALTLAPEMTFPRFQLGLLLMQEGQAAAAREQFSRLALTGEAPLAGYAKALHMLAEGDAQAAQLQLAQTLAEPQTASALKQDMEHLLNRLMSGVAAAPLARTSAATDGGRESALAGGFLGAYRTNREPDAT